MKIEIKQLHEQIWIISFDDPVDLAMHFLTYQEYYECANPIFRNNTNFDMLEFIEWYTKEHDSLFTYVDDWSGFNLPGKVFDEVKTINKYTTRMKRLVDCVIKPEIGIKDFYVLGHLRDDEHTLDHELAHAFYYINSDYKKECCRIINEYPNIERDFKAVLLATGYTDEVCIDETQAYFGTGLTDCMENSLKQRGTYYVSNMKEEMKTNFEKFRKKILK